MVTRPQVWWLVMLLFLILSGSNSLHAQHDTISLNPLTVRGFAPERFMAGLKVQRIDSVTIQQFRFQNISELLAFHSPMAFKNYGPGQLNTVAFRGTSSMHTAVLWNGLNINQPNLGQTDFSTLPVAGFERLAVQYGASASVVGTDAVGGSLLLESAGRQPSGLRAQLCRQQGSFNNFQTQAGATYGGKAGASSYFSGKTLVYDGQMNNNYGTTERRNYLFEPSKSRQRGLVQDLTWNLRKQRQISAHAWFTDNSVVLAPENPVAREQTRTQSYRSMVQYQTPSWTWRTAWIRDLIEFGKGDFSTPEHTGTDRFVTRLEKEKEWNLSKNGSPLSVRMGAELAHYRTRVEGYTLPLITENRADIFVMSRWQATERLLFSAALRQAFVTRFDPPLTPSVGVDYVFFTTQKTTLKAKGAVAKSYRVPTLNERYWKTLGNPDIRPERSWNKEIGVELKQNIADSQILTASLTAFHNRVDDWTYWNPERNYRVENLQLVVARGVEFLSRYQTTYLRWQLGATAGYALTRASQERLYDAYAADIVGKQLVYVPVHQGNLTIFAQRGTLRLTALGRAVKRSYYTFDNSRNLPGYVFVSLLGEKTLTLARLQATMQAQVHNLTNAFYLNVKRNAMPGRSFSFTLLVAYNSESK